MKTKNYPRDEDRTLTGKILVASPSMSSESYFFQSVIYMLKNTETGSIGVMVNCPIAELKETLLFDHKAGAKPLNLGQAYIGGPMARDVGCLLCLDQYNGVDSTQLIKIGGDQVLKRLIEDNKTAKQIMLILGHCAWKGGQLEEEIKTGSWMVFPMDHKIIFNNNNKEKWIKCLNSLKINLAYYVDSNGTG